MFTCEYENDPLGREKVNNAGERKDKPKSKVLKKVGDDEKRAEWRD